MKKSILSLLILFISFCVSAQTKLDSIQNLDEIVLSDVKLKQYASGIKVDVLSDSIISKNPNTLTGLLAFNSNIYFRENGFGMVSSPSFRGTNASQTAVIWNGININSQLNGQTDFNIINTTNFSSVSIRSGGGSVQYGSGAIGGSVHLDNKLKFYSHFDNTIRLSYGSFDTKKVCYTNDFGSNKWSGNVGVSYNESENDYEYLEEDEINENGQFNNLNLNVNLGYFVSDKDVLKLYHQSFNGVRNLSGSLIMSSRSKYEDENYRTMLEWSRVSGKFNSKFKAAHLQENFRFFQDKDNPDFSFGKVNTLLFNHSLNVRFSEKLQLKSIIDYSVFEGKGSSFGAPNRNAFSATALLLHKPTERLSYGLNLRKDFTSGFKSPFVLSVDAGYNVTKQYKLEVNASKNYRVPTFNDLYWQPGGNLDLVPESSYQLDFGQQLNLKYFSVKLNGYYINTKDLIQWRPNNSGIWSPQNVAEVENYGAEVELKSNYSINNHRFGFSAHYSYTVSENVETKKQLIYVPFHKGNLNLAYNYGAFSMYYQQLFNGDVFITDDNLEGRLYSLDFYNVSNIGFEYQLLKLENHQLEIGAKVNNLFNKAYQNVALRPMPNRNFNIQIHYKF